MSEPTTHNGVENIRRNQLTHAQMYQLCKMVDAEYRTAHLTDDGFAMRVQKRLPFPVTGSNVGRARVILGIEGRRMPHQTERSRDTSKLHREMRTVARVCLHIVDELGLDLRPDQLTSLKRICHYEVDGDDVAEQPAGGDSPK